MQLSQLFFLCISLITSSENLVLSQCQIPLLMLMVFVILFALVPDNILYGETGSGSAYLSPSLSLAITEPRVRRLRLMCPPSFNR